MVAARVVPKMSVKTSVRRGTANFESWIEEPAMLKSPEAALANVTLTFFEFNSLVGYAA